MIYNYYRLLDLEHKGTIVRTDGPEHEQYIAGVGWKRSGILVMYFCDESDYYDLYEEITEDEALALIEEATE